MINKFKGENNMKSIKYYHYTSLITLFSIVVNDELWLSNLKNSNDPNEFYLTCDEYNAYISKLGKDPYNGKPYVLEENGIYGNTYGLSFTLVGDNLSQWERYGDSLKGISICFDIELMQQILEDKYGFTFDFDSVRYTDEEKSFFIESKIENININRSSACPIGIWTMEAIYFINNYNQAQMLFKKEPFYSEQEYRLFFDPTYYDFFHKIFTSFSSPQLSELQEKAKKAYNYVTNTFQLTEGKKKFTLMRNGINSYIPFKLSFLGEQKREIIKEIILGPKCTQDPKELKAFLYHYGYNVKVTKSQIEIR